MMLIAVLAFCGSCSMVFFAMAARAQNLSNSQAISDLPAAIARGHVTFTAEPTDVVAGKPSVIELRFRVDDGFHINSHTPSDELLIPTKLSFEKNEAVKIEREEYPKGTAFLLEGETQETLDVYQGEFRVRVTIVAPLGESTLHGGLRYQACDKAACYPPRTLMVSAVLNGK